MEPAGSKIKLWRIAIWLFVVALLGPGGILLVLANRIPSRVAPAGIVWEIRDHNPSDEFDKPGGVLIAPSGDIVLFGAGRILKYHGTTGKALWRNANNAQVLAIDSHGDLYAANPGGNVLCKYAGEDGKLIWKQAHGERHRYGVEGIALDSSGNPVLAGFSSNDTRYYSYLAKYNALDGHLIWEHQGEDGLATELWHGSFGMKIGPDDDVVFVSSTKGQEIGSFPGRCFIQKFNGRDGRPLWTQRFQTKPRTNNYSQSVDLDGEGNVLVAGYSSDGRQDNTVISKFRALDGRLVWSSPCEIRVDGGNRPSAILVDQSDNVIVSVNWRGDNSSYEAHTLKYTGNDGKLLWEQSRRVHADSTTVAEACVSANLFLDRQGAIVLAGNRWNGSNIDYHFTWVSGDDGSVFHQVSYDGPAHDHDLLYSVAFALDGGVIAAGSSSNCAEWLKPSKSISRFIRNRRSYSGIQRESNHVFDDDPYNYDFMIVKFPPFSGEKSKR
ncbi:MAG: PQQ-binding-like beta-propeller repeat protein [Verrucomicrobiota bacterium]